MRTLVLLILVCFLGSCRKFSNLPDCINTKVEEFKKSEVVCRDATVKEYSFEGKTVYLFDAGSCIADGGVGVYENNCNYLGTLWGFSGNGKIDGVDFASTAFYKGTLWTNR